MTLDLLLSWLLPSKFSIDRKCKRGRFGVTDLFPVETVTWGAEQIVKGNFHNFWLEKQIGTVILAEISVSEIGLLQPESRDHNFLKILHIMGYDLKKCNARNGKSISRIFEWPSLRSLELKSKLLRQFEFWKIKSAGFRFSPVMWSKLKIVTIYLMNKVKNLGYDRWLKYKQPRQESGLSRYLQKCVTQIYRSLYGDAMFVPFWADTDMAAVK